MTTAIWIAFGLFLLVIAIALVWAGYQALRVWREVRKLPRGLLGELEEIARRAALAQERTTALEKQVADLQERVESLNGSLARMRVLVGAAGEFNSVVNSARRTFAPMK
jgi:predicted nuclease with TOPRIM domain